MQLKRAATEEAAGGPVRIRSAPLAEGITSVMRLSRNPETFMSQLGRFETASSVPEDRALVKRLKEDVAKVRRLRFGEIDILVIALKGHGDNALCLVFDTHPQNLTNHPAFMSMMKLEDPFSINGAGRLYVKRTTAQEAAALKTGSADTTSLLTVPPPVESHAPGPAELERWRRESGGTALEATREMGKLLKEGRERWLLELRRSILIEALHGIEFEHLRPEIHAAKRNMERWVKRISRFGNACSRHEFPADTLASQLVRPSRFLLSKRTLVPGLGYAVQMRGSGPVMRNSFMMSRSPEGIGIFALAEGTPAPFSPLVSAEAIHFLSNHKGGIVSDAGGLMEEFLARFLACSIRSAGLGRLSVAAGRFGDFRVFTYDRRDGTGVSEKHGGLVLSAGMQAPQAGGNAAETAERAVQEVLLRRLSGGKVEESAIVVSES